MTLTSWPSPPSIPIAERIPNIDKVVHLCLYAGEGLLIYLAVRWPGRAGFSLARVLAVAGAMAVFGILDEIHQTWIPGRSCEVGDVAADVGGAATGALVASALAGRRGTRAGLRATNGSETAAVLRGQPDRESGIEFATTEIGRSRVLTPANAEASAADPVDPPATARPVPGGAAGAKRSR
ncbi:MAG: VanZ family protein [Acidobacteria bacterium]|nr:VanZ family protein [Acidobacteriota bacterium]MCA1609408.1 VanZ family protein [Acidobacteriota bacterium]